MHIVRGAVQRINIPDVIAALHLVAAVFFSHNAVAGKFFPQLLDNILLGAPISVGNQVDPALLAHGESRLELVQYQIAGMVHNVDYLFHKKHETPPRLFYLCDLNERLFFSIENLSRKVRRSFDVHCVVLKRHFKRGIQTNS